MKELITLHKINSIAESAVRQAIGMTKTQAIILAAVAEAPGQLQTAYIAATGIDRSTLSQTLRTLIAGGYLTSRYNPKDRRGKVVRLTTKGSMLARHLTRQQDAILKNLTRQVDGLGGLSIRCV